MPAGVRPQDLWFDLSPMRPDEWGRQDAATWQRAVAIQLAYRKGIESADADASANEEVERRRQNLVAEGRGR